MQGCLYTGSLSRQIIDSCNSNGLMSTEHGMVVGTKFSVRPWSATARSRSLLSNHPWLPFSRIMHVHMLQRLLEILFIRMNANSSFAYLFAGYVACWAHVRFDWSESHSWSAFYSFKRQTLQRRMQAIWNSPPQANIQSLFDSMLCRIAEFFAASGGYTKYWFRILIYLFLPSL